MAIPQNKIRGNPVIVIAGGGTGGHIYPAIAIAKALKSQAPNAEIHFVGSRGGLEEKIVPRENYPLHTLPVGKLHRSVGLRGRMKSLVRMPIALWQAWRLLRRLKPQMAIGVGGYASGPFMFVASLARFPRVCTAIWEPNAFPGLANRMLAPMVDLCLVVFEQAQKHMKGRKFFRVGLPVRDEINALGVHQNESNLNKGEKFHLLIFGGSQGAHGINEVVLKAIEENPRWLEDVEIVHQTGPKDFQRVQEGYAGRLGIEAHEFLHDMSKRYRWADLILCRSGASTVAEICACRKPAVFVPLPTAADNHQQKNAQALVDVKAAAMVLQADFTPERLKELVIKFKNEPSLLKEMSQNLAAFYAPNAATETAKVLLKQLENS